MNKKVLIISPYFPPSNAADMQRIRMGLPYFEAFGWDTEIVTVDERYSDIVKDALLLKSVPDTIKIHKVKALSKSWTSKVGLGSLALRALWFYYKKVNSLLQSGHFDLVYFSTTQFPLCILGAYWKKRFGVKYIIDMQDPWHSDYYRDKPKNQQPPKFWFSYRLNKYLEPVAIKNADGLISVSENYLTNLKSRYPEIKNLPTAVITFGWFKPDIETALANQTKFVPLLDGSFKNVVYVGRGGMDMHKAIAPVFKALKTGLDDKAKLFDKLKFYFIGTSYAANGGGKPTILPLAETYGVEKQVVEITDRISFYHTLLTLQQADALFMPGSDDPAYTGSKIYPYLLTNKPMLAIFNSKSPALPVLKDFGAPNTYCFDEILDMDIKITHFLTQVANGNLKYNHINEQAAEKYSAETLTRRQCLFFSQVISE